MVTTMQATALHPAPTAPMSPMVNVKNCIYACYSFFLMQVICSGLLYRKCTVFTPPSNIVVGLQDRQDCCQQTMLGKNDMSVPVHIHTRLTWCVL